MDAREYDILFQVEDRHWWCRGLRRLLGTQWRRNLPREGVRSLDIGCGTGGVLQLVQHAGFAVGLDLSPHALACCRRRDLAHLTRGSGLELPFAAGSFSAATMLDVLCHQWVTDRAAALAEARRVLQPGGFLFVNVPAYQSLYSQHDIGVQNGHRFRRHEVRRLLEEAGFEVRFLSYWNTLLLPAAILVRLIRKFQPAHGSELSDTYTVPFTHLLGAVLRVEHALMRVVALPAGLSIFAVARKP